LLEHVPSLKNKNKVANQDQVPSPKKKETKVAKKNARRKEKKKNKGRRAICS
jgi:hypothetical protein